MTCARQDPCRATQSIIIAHPGSAPKFSSATDCTGMNRQATSSTARHIKNIERQNMIAIRTSKKDIGQYEIPTDVRRRAPALIALIEGENESCGLWERTAEYGCAALRNSTCYARAPSKDFAQVDSYKECPIYSFISRQRDMQGMDRPFVDVLRTLR